MPKDSCVDHLRRGDFIILRQHMIDLVGGDHCAASVLAYFEHATNGEMDRFDRQGAIGIPWVTATMPSIVEGTVRLYSLRSLQDRTLWMESIEFLQVDQEAPGKVKRYLLNVDFINTCIQQRRVFHYMTTIGKIADDAISKSADGFADGFADGRGGIKILGTENIEERIKPSVGSKDIESQPQTPEFPGATLDDEDSGAEPRKPFKRQWSRKKEPKPMSYTEAALKRMRGADVTGAPPRPEIPVPTTSAQNPPVILPVPGVIVAEWNKLVPSCPSTWSDSQDTPLLRKAMADVQFLDGYRDIFAKAELINQNSDRGPWLTLQSLLSNSKNGQPHWYRIYSGQYAGMMKPQAKRGGTPDYVEKLIAEREARRAKKRTEGTDAGN